MLPVPPMIATGSVMKAGEYRLRRPMIETRETEFTVEGGLLTDGPTRGRTSSDAASVPRGTIPVKVLSTPGMIGVMERTAAMLAFEQLPDGQATVGFEVCVKHVAGAIEGARCVARATLREVVDERKYRFDVEVLEGERTIGVGTHERRVVKRA